MKHIPSDLRSESLGGLALWNSENSEDNSLRLERMRRNLRLAKERELTPRQQEMLSLYYDQHLTMKEIALRLGINISTVSRTLQRARTRLQHSLRYVL